MSKKFLGMSIESLEAERSTALKGGTVIEQEWIVKFLEIMRRLLKNDIRRYRSFGPYWWIVKEAFLEAGITEFGEYIDSEWLDMTRYDTSFHGLLAALLYSGQSMNMGMIYANSHNVSIEEENGIMDEQVYVLADDDMETLAIEKSFR